FHSIWFTETGIFLVLNITICSINRWPGVWASVSGSTPIKHRDWFHAGGSNSARTRFPEAGLTETEASVIGLLERRGYRTQTARSSDAVYLTGTRNRFSPLGTYLGHLSLILFIVGFLVTSFFGFRDPSFIVAEGTEEKVGHGTSLSLHLESFSDEYWPDGTPKDYRSEVVLYSDGEEVDRGTIRVNDALHYQGIRFHQSFFGPAAVIRVETLDGQSVQKRTVALSGRLQSHPFQRPTGSFPLASKNLAVRLIGPATNLRDPSIADDELGLELYEQDTMVPVGWDKVKKGTPVQLGDLQFAYLQDVTYSGFQVSRDPGNMLIWIASALFLGGVGMVFYLPRRLLWALIQQVERGSQVSIRWAPARGPGGYMEFQGLLKEIQSLPSLNNQSQRNHDGR
ncbi:MAG: cytochrome c biogenesis protein ResB, partial [Chloroflexota bacterium]